MRLFVEDARECPPRVGGLAVCGFVKCYGMEVLLLLLLSPADPFVAGLRYLFCENIVLAVM